MNFDSATMGITRDSEKVICYLYHCYLDRRDSGESRLSAKEFDKDFWRSNPKLSKWNPEDISDCISELYEHGYIQTDILDNITLTDSVIIYMEGRFRRGLADAWDIITDIFP